MILYDLYDMVLQRLVYMCECVCVYKYLEFEKGVVEAEDDVIEHHVYEADKALHPVLHHLLQQILKSQRPSNLLYNIWRLMNRTKPSIKSPPLSPSLSLSLCLSPLKSSTTCCSKFWKFSTQLIAEDIW